MSTFELMSTFSDNCIFSCFFTTRFKEALVALSLSKARPKADQSSELGWQKKSEQKKRYHDSMTTTTTTTNFVPGQTIHFLVEVFAVFSLFQPPKTFSYAFHFHNLLKRHYEKRIFANKFF